MRELSLDFERSIAASLVLRKPPDPERAVPEILFEGEACPLNFVISWRCRMKSWKN
jgi:hypothetical protein